MHIRKSQGDRLNISGRRTGGGARVVRTGFIKGDIPRDPHPTSNRIITAITLMLGTVPKEDTLNGLSSQLGALTWREKNKANTPKTSEVTVARRTTKKALVGSTPLKNGGGLPVNKKNSRGDSLSPEVRWKLRGEQESTRSLKNVTMLTLSHTILSMSTRARKLSKCTLISKKATMRVRDVLSSRVSTKGTDG
jgi:hypothetical protein